MKTKKIILTIGIIILLGLLLFKISTMEEYLVEIKYNEFIEMMDDKKSFVLCISQTTCGHCAEYKKTLNSVAKKYKIKIYFIESDLFSKEEKEGFITHINYNFTPTTVFIKNGEEKSMANRINGGKSIEYTINKLKSNGFIK